VAITLSLQKKIVTADAQTHYTPFEARVIAALRSVYDPEIPVNIYDLGLIYNLKIDEATGEIDILMTLTTPNCPVAEDMPAQVREAVKLVEGAGEVKVDLTFDPPWDKDMLSESALLELGLL
jgi:FeS assembly SUF system protein